jgi:hypothetical protein
VLQAEAQDIDDNDDRNGVGEGLGFHELVQPLLHWNWLLDLACE